MCIPGYIGVCVAMCTHPHVCACANGDKYMHQDIELFNNDVYFCDVPSWIKILPF